MENRHLMLSFDSLADEPGIILPKSMFISMPWALNRSLLMESRREVPGSPPPVLLEEAGSAEAPMAWVEDEESTVVFCWMPVTELASTKSFDHTDHDQTMNLFGFYKII
jgi:hypothetical protein